MADDDIRGGEGVALLSLARARSPCCGGRRISSPGVRGGGTCRATCVDAVACIVCKNDSQLSMCTRATPTVTARPSMAGWLTSLRVDTFQRALVLPCRLGGAQGQGHCSGHARLAVVGFCGGFWDGEGRVGFANSMGVTSGFGRWLVLAHLDERRLISVNRVAITCPASVPCDRDGTFVGLGTPCAQKERKKEIKGKKSPERNKCSGSFLIYLPLVSVPRCDRSPVPDAASDPITDAAAAAKSRREAAGRQAAGHDGLVHVAERRKRRDRIASLPMRVDGGPQRS